MCVTGNSGSSTQCTIPASTTALPKGDITTLAGTDIGSFGGVNTGDGGPARQADVNDPSWITVDDTGNYYVRTDGEIRTVNSSGTINAVTITSCPNPRSLDDLQATPDGTSLYVSAGGCGHIIKHTVAGGAETSLAGNGTAGTTGDSGLASAAEISPVGIALDSAGNLFLTDNDRVRQVGGPSSAAPAYINTVAGNGATTFVGDGGPAVNAGIDLPGSVVTDRSGNVYIGESPDNRVRFVCQKPATASCSTPFGSVTGQNVATIAGDGVGGSAGDGGLATSAEVIPAAVALDPNGNLFISQSYGVRFVCMQSSTCNTVFGTVASGEIITAAGDNTRGFSGDGGPAQQAQLYLPEGMAIDSSGNLYIADSGNNRIRFVCMQLTACTTPFGAVASGSITTIAGNGVGTNNGDGGPAANAAITPHVLALDASGNLYADSGFTGTIRSICVQMTICGTNVGVVPAGYVTTVAGNGSACRYSSTNTCGDGGPATSASFNGADALAVDNPGNLIVSDFGANVVRVICMNATCPSYLSATTPIPQGDINTIAGNGTQGSSGDGHPANAAAVEYVFGVAADSANNVFLAQATRDAPFVREVTAPLTLQPYPTPLHPSFPLTAVGGSSGAQTVSLTNPTSSSITVSAITISGTNASDYAITTGSDHCSGTTLTAGGTCAVQVVFRPSASGPRTATLSFADNAATSLQTAGLVGQGAGAYFAFSPSPIATAASLGAGAPVAVTVTDHDASGNVVPNASVYLAFAPTRGGGTASAGGVALTTTPQAFTANSVGQVAVTYTTPSALPTGGEDVITAQNAASSPTVTSTDSYDFSKVATYKYSVSPIAATGALGPRVTVKVVLTARTSSGTAVPGATVYLSFVRSAGGGSARVGTTALTATPTAFKTTSKGTIIIAYTTPRTLPSSNGTDTITATDATLSPSVTTSDSYTF